MAEVRIRSVEDVRRAASSQTRRATLVKIGDLNDELGTLLREATFLQELRLEECERCAVDSVLAHLGDAKARRPRLSTLAITRSPLLHDLSRLPSSLTNVDLTASRLSGRVSIPDGLEWLSLANNRITHVTLGHRGPSTLILSGNVHLDTLDASQSLITELFLENCPRLFNGGLFTGSLNKGLVRLVVAKNRIGDDALIGLLATLKGAPRLIDLDLSDNAFDTGLLAPSEALRGLLATSLRRLRLDGNRHGDALTALLLKAATGDALGVVNVSEPSSEQAVVNAQPQSMVCSLRRCPVATAASLHELRRVAQIAAESTEIDTTCQPQVPRVRIELGQNRLLDYAGTPS